ncbi:ABC transporter permease [Paenibacillus taiwanensis]|uniref:ABC transporter permease n=1 Tax=Paenibacillus taiwanensis TaxID=401638 RepID=UPI0004296B4E|nr:ABC transporter permease [Paenibacillus taiwanensis]
MSYFAGLVSNEWMKANSKRQLPYYYAFLFIMIVALGTIMRLFIFKSAGEFSSMDFLDTTVDIASIVTLYFMIVVSAQIITDEYKDGTIKQLLIRPASRTTILMSKLVNLVVIVLSVYLISTIIGYLTGIILFNGATTTTLGGVLAKLGFSIPGLLFYSLLAFTVAVLTKSLGISIIIPIALQSIVGPLMGMFASKAWYKFLIFPNLNWGVYFKDQGASLPYDGASFGLAALIYGVYIMVLLLITIFFFNKRDVQ